MTSRVRILLIWGTLSALSDRACSRANYQPSTYALSGAAKILISTGARVHAKPSGQRAMGLIAFVGTRQRSGERDIWDERDLDSQTMKFMCIHPSGWRPLRELDLVDRLLWWVCSSLMNISWTVSVAHQGYGPGPQQ